jgi:DNA-binding response OmpR family regulator
LRRLREERERLTRTALALSDAPIERLVPLIIEGDETSAAHIRRAFDKLGLPFPHPVAKSPREAMDALMRPALPRPTLALLALPVPEEPAFEFLSWFREQPDFQALPVFILSSSLAPRTRTRAFELGASGYFSKPTFPGEHVELIKSVIVRWGTFLRGGPRPSPETEPSASVLEWLRASS